MKWQFKEPETGDMIRVKLNDIYHYGVFVSENEIIQFGLPPVAQRNLKNSEIEVCTSDINTFLCGGFLEVAEFSRAEKKKNRPSNDIVAYARKKLGERGYNILYNNCEHFAYDCVTGKPYCSQTANIRAFFQSIPVVDVYVARIPEQPQLSVLSCVQREEEIAKINNPKVKFEKYYVWKLLEHALERSFGIRAQSISFTKTDTGKWTTKKCCFSLSHCNGAVAVAVSRNAVGVDIETQRPLSKERFAGKILTPQEHELYEQAQEQERFLLEKWTAKESLFKKDGKASFVPCEYDTLINKLLTQNITLAQQDYVISIATDNPEAIRFYIDVDLSSV